MTTIAIRNAARFNTLANAVDFRRRMRMTTPILLGDDGRYWVPANTREAGWLMQAGYEEAKEAPLA